MSDPKDRMTGLGASRNTVAGSGVTSSNQSTEIERDAAAAEHSARQAAEDAKAKAQRLGEEMKETAKDATNEARQQAHSFASEQKEEIAGQVDGVAHALRSAAGSLDEQRQGAFAGYARDAASGLERVSDAISRRSVDDLVETVEDFARRQPVAFLGGAVLAGFVMSRFAKSSAERRHMAARDYDYHQQINRGPLENGGHGVGASYPRDDLHLRTSQEIK